MTGTRRPEVDDRKPTTGVRVLVVPVKGSARCVDLFSLADQAVLQFILKRGFLCEACKNTHKTIQCDVHKVHAFICTTRLTCIYIVVQNMLKCKQARYAGSQPRWLKDHNKRSRWQDLCLDLWQDSCLDLRLERGGVVLKPPPTPALLCDVTPPAAPRSRSAV